MDSREREVFALLLSVWQAGRLYSPDHPQFLELVDRAYRLITEILREEEELTLAAVGEDLVVNQKIIVDQSQKFSLFFQGLKERGLERLTFYPGLEKEELTRFLAFICLPQKRTEQDIKNFLELEGIKHITAGKLKALVEDREKPVPDYAGSFDQVLAFVALVARKLPWQEEISPLELKYLVLSILENFSGTYWQGNHFWLSLKPEEKLWAHLVNTAILVTTFSTRFGFPREDVIDLGLAALFHDIGEVFFPGPALVSGDNHMIRGARILLKYRESLSPLPAIVALEHHLRYDLKGQPKLRGINEPHQASLIVSIADIYDKLVKKWAYDERFDPLFIYELMKAEKGRVFSPEWLEAFFQVMGIWPEGCEVLLSEGQKGRVVRPGKDDPLRPKVEVNLPEGRREMIDLSLERKISIVQTVNPFSRSKNQSKN